MIAEPPPRPAFVNVGTAQTAGSSYAADELATLLCSALAHWAPTASLGATLQELDDARADASVPDWSADGDEPMSAAGYSQARRLLTALLPWGPRPDISTEPNGEPAFDWNFGPDRWLVASIDGAGRINFASRKGSERLGGTTYFLGSAPSRIVSTLAELQRD